MLPCSQAKSEFCPMRDTGQAFLPEDGAPAWWPAAGFTDRSIDDGWKWVKVLNNCSLLSRKNKCLPDTFVGCRSFNHWYWMRRFTLLWIIVSSLSWEILWTRHGVKHSENWTLGQINLLGLCDHLISCALHFIFSLCIWEPVIVLEIAALYVRVETLCLSFVRLCNLLLWHVTFWRIACSLTISSNISLISEYQRKCLLLLSPETYGSRLESVKWTLDWIWLCLLPWQHLRDDKSLFFKRNWTFSLNCN